MGGSDLPPTPRAVGVDFQHPVLKLDVEPAVRDRSSSVGGASAMAKSPPSAQLHADLMRLLVVEQRYRAVRQSLPV